MGPILRLRSRGQRNDVTVTWCMSCFVERLNKINDSVSLPIMVIKAVDSRRQRQTHPGMHPRIPWIPRIRHGCATGSDGCGALESFEFKDDVILQRQSKL